MLEVIIWMCTFIVISCFGVTMSWSMTVVLFSMIAVASIYTASINWRSSLRSWDLLDSFSLVALAFFVTHAWCSPVVDLAKEDVLFFGGAWLVFNGFRSRRLWFSGVIALIVMVFLNISYVGLQSWEVEAMPPISLVSDLAARTQDFGLFQDYGSLGNASAMAAVACLVFGVWGRGLQVSHRLVLLIAGVSSALVCFQSGSRIGAVSFSIGVFLLLVFSWFRSGNLPKVEMKRWRVGVVFCGIVALLLSTLLLKQTLEQRDQRMVATGNVLEENIRQQYWAVALEQAIKEPIVGTGARTYSYLNWEYWKGVMRPSDADPQFVHNEYIQTYADYGLLGLAVLLLTLSFVLYKGTQMLLEEGAESKEYPIRLAGLLIVVVAAIHCLTDFAMRIPLNWVMLSMGLGWCLLQRSEDEGAKGKSFAVYVPVVIAGATIGLLIPELRAAVPLVKAKQVRDYPGWVIDKPEAYLEAYEKANRLAPDFRRSYRIALIHQKAYDEGDTSSFTRAVEAYQESLYRHPDNPVVIFNLATLHQVHGDFEEAEQYFKRSEPYASALEYHGKYYVSRARNFQALANMKFHQDDLSAADEYIQESRDTVKNGRAYRGEILAVIRDAIIAQIQLALANGSSEKVLSLEGELRAEVPAHVLRQVNSRTYKRLGDIYYSAAIKEMQGNGIMWKKLFESASKYYRQDQSIYKQIDEERDQRMALAQQMSL